MTPVPAPPLGRSIPGLVGLAKEPKPWDATLPAPVLKVPPGFCSPNDDVWPKPKLLEPVLPNRPAPPGGQRNPPQKTTVSHMYMQYSLYGFSSLYDFDALIQSDIIYSFTSLNREVGDLASLGVGRQNLCICDIVACVWLVTQGLSRASAIQNDSPGVITH